MVLVQGPHSETGLESHLQINMGKKKSLGDLVKMQIVIQWVWTKASDSVFPGQTS